MAQAVRGGPKEGLSIASAEASLGLRNGELYQRSEFTQHPVVRILNTYPRLHGRKLRQVTDLELDTWAEGADVVWAMGLQKRSSAAVAHAKEWSFQYDEIMGGVKDGDVVGSAFSVGDFLPDSALVGNDKNWDEVIEFRKRLNARGKKLYGDGIFHGVAPDHAWVKEHPDWFIHVSEAQYNERSGDYFRIKANDGKEYFIAKGRSDSERNDIPWADIAQFNLTNKETQDALIDVARMYGKVFDGIRIDMAMLLVPYTFENIWGRFLTPEQQRFLNEQKQDINKQFLPRLLDAARQSAGEDGRDYKAIAESYSHFGQDGNLLQSVDQIYEKGWYDHMLRVVREGASLPELAEQLNINMDSLALGALFTGNHDEVPPVREFRYRVVSERTLPNGEKEAMWDLKDHELGVESSLAAASIMALLPAGAFILDDTQMDGYDGKRIPMQVGRLPDFPLNSYTSKFYEGLFALKHTQLFQEGRYSIAPTKYRKGQEQFDLGHPGILPLHVQSQDQTEGVIIASNLKEQSHGCVLPITGDMDIEVFDLKQGKWLPQEIIDQQRNGGFSIVLDGYQVQAVHYKKRVA